MKKFLRIIRFFNILPDNIVINVRNGNVITFDKNKRIDLKHLIKYKKDFKKSELNDKNQQIKPKPKPNIIYILNLPLLIDRIKIKYKYEINIM